MITNQKIIDEVNRLLVEIYPNYTVYINQVKDGFERPSFFIEFIIDNSSEINKNTTDESLFLQLTYFAKEDKFGLVDSIEQQEVLIKLKNLFKKGYITVEDRAIRVNASGITVDGEIGLNLKFSYFEDRPSTDYDCGPGSGTGGNSSGQYSLMKEIIIKEV
jgi:hypothetical protein